MAAGAQGFFPWPFPWPRRKDDEEEEAEEEDGLAEGFPPVLLVPGIGGSILDAVFDNNKRERIWVRLLRADHEFRTKLWSKYNPKTGKTESLDANSHIEVPQDNFGLFACDILEPGLRVNLDMVNYFHNLIVDMRKWGYVDGKDLFGFGYDFRQSNRFGETMMAFKEKLQSIHEATGKKVCLVTHSMGGLLFKSFLALHHSEVAAHVDKWIAIAAPFRGAPGFIMDTLLTGVDFIKGWEKSLFIAKWTMHQLLVECPSVYELMAEYEFDWEETPELRIVRAVESNTAGQPETEVQKICTPSKVFELLHGALQNNSVTVAGEVVPLPLSWPIVEWAAETRRIWKAARLPESVQFYNIYGTGLETPHHTSYGSEKNPIDHLSEILHTEAEFEFVEGDGTVPVESSKSDDLPAIWRVGVPGEHRALLRDPRVFRLLRFFLEVGEPDPDYDPVTDYVLVPTKEELAALEQLEPATIVPGSKAGVSGQAGAADIVSRSQKVFSVTTNSSGNTITEVRMQTEVYCAQGGM